MRVLCLCGSKRRESFNARLLEVAMTALARHDGVAVDSFSAERLAALPLMDQDLEAASGIPAEAVALKAAMTEADGLLWVCPEYNGSITPLMKNAIDWASRPHERWPAASCFGDKPMALLAASPGALGGLRGLRHVREILANLGALVLPQQLAVSRAAEAFDGVTLTDARQQAALEGVVAGLLAWTGRAAGARA